MSIPTDPKTFFADATKLFPGLTILSTFLKVFVPYVKAAIEWLHQFYKFL